MNELVEKVKAHALAHYEEGGWDFVVEAMQDDEIAKILEREGAKDEKQAIGVMAEIAGLLDEQRREIQSTIF